MATSVPYFVHAANSQQNFATVLEMREDLIKLCDNYIWVPCHLVYLPPNLSE